MQTGTSPAQPCSRHRSSPLPGCSCYQMWPPPGSCVLGQMLQTTPGIWPNRTGSVLEVWKLLSGSLSRNHDKAHHVQPRRLALVLHVLSADEDHYIFPASFSFEKIVNATLTVLKTFHSCPILRNVQQGLQKRITPSDGEIKPSSFQGKAHCLTDGNITAPYKWDVGSGRNRGGNQGKHTSCKYIGLVFSVFYFALLRTLLLYLVWVNYQLFWHRLSQEVIFCAGSTILHFSSQEEGGKKTLEHDHTSDPNQQHWSLIKHRLLWGGLARACAQLVPAEHSQSLTAVPSLVCTSYPKDSS